MADIIVASDTFTEGTDTALASHTPDVGTSWVVGSGTGSATVVAATDKAVAATNSNGNRHYISDSLGRDIGVYAEGDFTRPASGSTLFWGPTLRVVTATGLEKVYLDFATSTALYGVHNGTTKETVGGSWSAGVTKRMRVEITPSGVVRGFVDGSLVLTHTVPVSAGSDPNAGIVLGTFSSGNFPVVDNFECGLIHIGDGRSIPRGVGRGIKRGVA